MMTLCERNLKYFFGFRYISIKTVNFNSARSCSVSMLVDVFSKESLVFQHQVHVHIHGVTVAIRLL